MGSIRTTHGNDALNTDPQSDNFLLASGSYDGDPGTP